MAVGDWTFDTWFLQRPQVGKERPRVSFPYIPLAKYNLIGLNFYIARLLFQYKLAEILHLAFAATH